MITNEELKSKYLKEQEATSDWDNIERITNLSEKETKAELKHINTVLSYYKYLDTKIEAIDTEYDEEGNIVGKFYDYSDIPELTFNQSEELEKKKNKTYLESAMLDKFNFQISLVFTKKENNRIRSKKMKMER